LCLHIHLQHVLLWLRLASLVLSPAGDWLALGPLLSQAGQGGYYDLILSAETIYSTDSQQRLLTCMKQVGLRVHTTGTKWHCMDRWLLRKLSLLHSSPELWKQATHHMASHCTALRPCMLPVFLA
jgi:hypothetical protein